MPLKATASNTSRHFKTVQNSFSNKFRVLTTNLAEQNMVANPKIENSRRNLWYVLFAFYPFIYFIRNLLHVQMNTDNLRNIVPKQDSKYGMTVKSHNR